MSLEMNAYVLFPQILLRMLARFGFPENKWMQNMRLHPH
jgi:hypothetical protein